MRSSQVLNRIPVVSMTNSARARGVDWKLRTTRFGFLALIILVPITGLFRIDVSAGFVVLDRQIWFSDFFIVFGMWLAMASVLIMLYSILGNVFCGWACPQNTLSTWANDMTRKHLGKSAVIDWIHEKNAKVASARNTKKNWLQLSIKLLLMSMLAALIPLLYFYPPGAIWSFLTFQEDNRLGGSLHWIYAVFTFIVLVNLAVVRHFVCRYMCVYRMWQFLFRTRDTLHVIYDKSRDEDCAKCNFCVTTCSVEVDPRETSTFDSCINCGECITACNSLQEKKDKKGLLSFKFGPRRNNEGKIESNLISAKQRLMWVSPAFALGMGLFLWGLVAYNPYHAAVYRGDGSQGKGIDNYRISMANKMYRPGELEVSVEGLPTSAYVLEKNHVAFATSGRDEINLQIVEDALEVGLHSFVVHVNSLDGWQDSFQILHISE